MKHKNSEKAEMLINTLAEVLKEYRLKLHKSQRILADEYDIPRSLLSRIESGKNEAMIVSIWSICEALQMRTSEVIAEVEKRLPSDFALFDN